MRELYLDTEFNGFKGEFISMGIHDPKGADFYAVIDSPYRPNEFVTKHVLPNLKDTPIDSILFRKELTYYFSSKFDECCVYADWPEDFTHLLSFFCGPKGRKYIKRMTFKLITTPDIHISKTPHNALEDAIAFYKNHQEMLKEESQNDQTS